MYSIRECRQPADCNLFITCRLLFSADLLGVSGFCFTGLIVMGPLLGMVLIAFLFEIKIRHFEDRTVAVW